jgi:polyhydroxyalkanoate synthesis regulator phasin
MKGVDTRGKFDDLFSDKYLKISEKRLHNICKIEAGDKTCRYITLCSNGFMCLKNTKIKEAIDKMVEENKMTAKGDNCSGLVQGMLSNAKKKEKSCKESCEESFKEGCKEESKKGCCEKEASKEKRKPGKEASYKIKAIRTDI